MNANQARVITLQAVHDANPWLGATLRPVHSAIEAAARAQRRVVPDPTPLNLPEAQRAIVHLALRLEGYSVLADVLEGEEIGMADTFTIAW